MSSGDMTTYVRGKQEERGNSNETFMMDGFDRWAESDAPNRVGGMYKEPAERTRRRRRGRGLDTFDSESESDSDSGSDSGSGSEGYGRRRRRRGGAINFSDSSESSDSSDFSDSSEELSGGRHRRGRRHRRGGDDVLDFFTGNQSSQPMSQSYEAVEAPRGVISGMPGMGYKMADDGQIAMASAQLTDDQIKEIRDEDKGEKKCYQERVVIVVDTAEAEVMITQVWAVVLVPVMILNQTMVGAW
jgi:hypothetical protein